MKITINNMTFWGLSNEEKREARNELKELRDGLPYSQIEALKVLADMRCFHFDLELGEEDKDHISRFISDYLI